MACPGTGQCHGFALGWFTESSGVTFKGKGLTLMKWLSLSMKCVEFFCLINVCVWQHIYRYLTRVTTKKKHRAAYKMAAQFHM